MALKLEGILKMYLHAENEVARLRHSKLLAVDEMYMANKKNTKIDQCQRSRSNVTNFQPLLTFTMGHIPTELHQFLISSLHDFVQTHTDTQRDAA